MPTRWRNSTLDQGNKILPLKNNGANWNRQGDKRMEWKHGTKIIKHLHSYIQLNNFPAE